ncbi:MAG: DUF1772 domain-containing protein [Mycobacterium sp.]|uniref:DUF1772 domain-containing protein n=1 Tax=Mycobacterium sp. TaxID=1785 RepID=UPI001ED448D3|nr:DUF1772 domain-containing protein [Mycobacterium sp.]
MDHNMDTLAVVLTGLMAGVELAAAAFFNPITRKLSDDAFRAARGRAARTLGTLMPFWYAVTLLVLGSLAIEERGESRDWLFGIAAGLMALIVLMTVTLLVPLSNRIAKWPATGEHSRDVAARFDRLHQLRTVLLVAVFTVLAIAVT